MSCIGAKGLIYITYIAGAHYFEKFCRKKKTIFPRVYLNNSSIKQIKYPRGLYLFLKHCPTERSFWFGSYANELKQHQD